MKSFLALAFSAVLLGLPAHAQDHSPEAVAAAILTGFTRADATMILPHLNAYNAEAMSPEVFEEHPFETIFDDPRAHAAMAWDGMILPARFDYLNTAFVPFAIETETGFTSLTSGEPGRLIVVFLDLDSPEDTTWGWEDFGYMDRERYLGFLEERE